MKYIYIFNGNGSSLPNAVFSSLKKAETWIKLHKLSGILAKYPINISVFDWAIDHQYFAPKNEFQQNAKKIQTFTSAYLEHYHYEDGKII